MNTPHPCLNPGIATLAKLASVVAHAQELTGPNGDEADHYALAALLDDEEVVRWMTDMRSLALVPEPR